MNRLYVASHDPEFGVMTDHEKISNGLYRFGGAPSMTSINIICQGKDSPRFGALGIADCVFVPVDRLCDVPEYYIATNVASHPNQWTGYIDGLEKHLPECDQPDRANLFECIMPECLADLQSGKAYLLLDQTHEGYNAPWLWEWFYLSIKKYNIPSNNVIYITGDMLSPDLHQAYCDKNLIPESDRINVLGYSLFEEGVYSASVYEWKHEKITLAENIAHKQANIHDIKTYNCLQKRPRNHRLWLFKELHNHGILYEGINTMNFIEDSERMKGEVYFHDEKMESYIVDQMNEILPMLPDRKYENYHTDDLTEFAEICSGKWQMMLNRDILLDSWVSVISEASASSDQCFCSEKIFKPVIQEHPFLVWGDRYTMAKMRELGYQTFDNWWSEAYDVQDMRKRLDYLITTMVELCNKTSQEWFDIYTDMTPVLKHNSQLIKTKSAEDVRDELKFITGKIS